MWKKEFVAKSAALSPALLAFSAPAAQLRQLVPARAEPPMDLFLGWGVYDFRLSNQQIDVRANCLDFKAFLEERGFAVEGGSVPDGVGWSAWRNRTDEVLVALFPAEER